MLAWLSEGGVAAMLKRIAKVLMLAVAVFAVTGSIPAMADGQEQVWRDSFSRDANGKLVRFIPPELWAGANWNGDRNLNRLPPFDRQAKRSLGAPKIYITGPIRVAPKDYPTCTKPVYKWDQRMRSGDKFEYYQINIEPGGRKGGIGRCYRDAYGRIGHLREFSKFPIGYWTEGEEYRNIRILDLGTPESPCLKFRWRGGRGGKSWGEYTYCPGKGRHESDSSGRQLRRTDRGNLFPR